MCPRVKQVFPHQPLTPGSFIRLSSRQSRIDKGHRRGHPPTAFSSIQLKHQEPNQGLVFIGTLIVFIDWHVVQLKVLPSTTQWCSCFPVSANSSSVLLANLKTCNICSWRWKKKKELHLYVVHIKTNLSSQFSELLWSSCSTLCLMRYSLGGSGGFRALMPISFLTDRTCEWLSVTLLCLSYKVFMV